MKVGDLFAVLHLDKKTFSAGLAAAKGEAGGLATVMGKVGIAMGVVVAAVGAAAVVLAADFQKGMANVQTLIGAGSESDRRIGELGAAVKKMSEETGKSLDDLSGGLYEVIGTFGDTADTVGLLEVAARAGAAGMSTTQDAVRLLAALTKSYGDTSVEAAQHSADLAFQTANLGVTTFPEMAQAMGRVIPTAAALKVKQEELFAVMATLTGVTGSTDEVVTQLRGSMTAMLKPSGEMRKALAELGYTGVTAGQDIVGEKGIVGSIQALAASASAGEFGIAKLWRNTNTLNAVLALTGGQAETFTAKLAAMGDVAGVTNTAFEIQQKTVSAMVDRIVAKLGVMMVNLGEKLLPVVMMVLEWILDNWPKIAGTFDLVANVIGKSVQFTVLVIEKFIGILNFIKPVLIALGAVVAAVVIPALAAMAVSAGIAAVAMAAAFAIPMAVIAALIAAVFAVSAAVNFFAMDFGSMGDRIHKIADAAGKDFNDLKEWIRADMEATGHTFEEAADAAERHFGTMTQALGGNAEASASHYMALGRAAQETAGVVGAATAALGGSFEDMGDDIEEETEDAAEDVKTATQEMLEAIQGLEDPVRDAGAAAADAWLEPIKIAADILSAETELASKEMRENLASEDAGIAADARLRTATLVAELITLRNRQAAVGDETAQIASSKALLTSKFMKDGLASNDRQIRLTFENWRDQLQARIGEMESAASRSQIGNYLASAIGRQRAAAVNAARLVASQVRAQFPGSEPADPTSPFRGITRGWDIGKVLTGGMERSLGASDYGDLFSRGITPGVAAAGGVPGMAGEKGAGDQYINIRIDSFTGSDRDIDKFADRLAYRLRLAGA